MLKSFFVGLAAVGITISGAMAADVTLIHAGQLIATPGEGAQGPSTIVVEGNRISEIVEGHVNREGAEVIDLKDKTVLPGLIDAHVHLSGDPGGDYWQSVIREPAYYAAIAVKNAGITLRAGFTTVRDVGSRGMTTMHAIRDAVRDGVVEGPRILSAGSSLSIIGGHGDTNGFAKHVLEAVFPYTSTGACTGAVECAQRVREASKYGADLIKITATGGVLSQQGRGLDQHFSDEEMESIIETAHRLGLKVAAHAHGKGGITAAVAAGVDSIEHGTYLDEDGAKLMKRTGAYMVPTLMAFEGIREGLAEDRYTPVVSKKVRQTLEVVGKGLQLAVKRGVNIAFGTDAGVFEHGRNAGEFALMLRYGGMSAEAALKSATVDAANLLGMSSIGTIEAGKYADIIAVDGDPLEDVTVLEHMRFVMKDGKIIDLD
ncbi:MAG: amidohydrolase family protein [Sphingomonadales bacterium]|jgi:imidazolonepropionase-like amidohydrolase